MEANKHPVLEEIERRQRGDSPQLKLALAIEGGAIRGTVTAGMVCALESSKIDPFLFDAHFGSSAGSYVSSYYISERTRFGATMFYEHNNGGEFIDLKQALLRRRPVLSLDHVLEDVMVSRLPIDFQGIVDSGRLHVLATRLSDLSRHIFEPAASVTELKNQLRAGAAIPGVAGDPVEIDGQQYIDASLTEPLPYQAAIDRGYDGVLLLSSRHEHMAEPGKNDLIRKLMNLVMAKQINIKRKEILEIIAARKELDAQRLAEIYKMTHDPDEKPYVFSIHPSTEYPVVKQMEKNADKIIAGTKAGYLAVKEALGHPIPQSFSTNRQFYGNY